MPRSDVEGFGAVVAGPDCYAVGGEDFADVVRVDAVYCEGDDSFVVFGVGGSDYVYVRDLLHFVESMFGHGVL